MKISHDLAVNARLGTFLAFLDLGLDIANLVIARFLHLEIDRLSTSCALGRCQRILEICI